MSRRLLFAVIVFGAIYMSGAGPASGQGEDVQAGTQPPSFRVRIYNYEKVADGDLSTAREIAGGVFKRAGLRGVWQNCTLDSPNRDSLDCDLQSAPIDLTLYVVAALADHAPYVHGNALGYSIIPHDGGPATMAYVSFARVKTLRSAFCPKELLGLAMAHEIGHLLLRTNEHSTYGLMKAAWTRRDLELRSWDEFRFSSEQARYLRAGILTGTTSREQATAIHFSAKGESQKLQGAHSTL